VAEDLVSEDDVARLLRGYSAYNRGDYDDLREFVSDEIVMERVGGQPTIHGWEAFRAFQDPDAFSWQQIEVHETITNGGKILVRIHTRARGSVSGVEVSIDGWMVWTMRDHMGVHVLITQDEAEAERALGLAPS